MALILCMGVSACGEIGRIVAEPTTEPAEPKEAVWVVTKIEGINQEGDVISMSQGRYNDDGEQIFWGTNLKGQLSVGDECTCEYDFDAQNRLVEMRKLESSGAREIYTFNSEGYIIEKVGYYSSGKQSDRQVYEYDEAGRIVTNIDYYDSGSLDRKLLYEYRQDGTCEKITCYEKDDVLLYITECDETGKAHFTQYYNAKAHTYTYKYEYDSHGNMTERYQYFGTSTREQSHDRFTYQQIMVTPLQKMILEAQDRTSP